MALKWADNVIEESTSTTTGAYQLGGVPADAEPGAQTFVAGIGDTHTCYYYAQEVGGTAWERGIGTVADAATDTLTRTTIHGSSNAGAAVDWTGKTVQVMVVLPARRLYQDNAHTIDNLTISTSRSGNAETIALKTAAGADPTPADPIRIAFRNATAGTGDFTVLEITAATSITISSGSTLGATSAVPFRIWLTGFNDGGTFRPGVIKCALTDGVYGLQDNVLESSTAEGGTGTADSAGVIYTGTAVTAKPMRVLVYLEYTLTTAGTWDAAPSLVSIYSHGDRLPGEAVQVRRNQTGATASGTTTIPQDDTIPQNTEGTEFMTQAITPRSAVNLLHLYHCASYTSSVSNLITTAFFQDTTAGALAVSSSALETANYVTACVLNHYMLAGTTSSTTFKLRAGGANASTTKINANASGRLYGGVCSAVMQVTEIMV